MQHLCDQLTIRAELIFPCHLWAVVVQHNRCNSTICVSCSTSDSESIESVLSVNCIVRRRHLRIITIELSAITQKHEHTHMTQSQWGNYHNQFHQDQTRGEKNLDQMIFEDIWSCLKSFSSRLADNPAGSGKTSVKASGCFFVDPVVNNIWPKCAR